MRIGFIGPGGRGFRAHVKSLCEHHAQSRKIELVGVSEVYETQRDKVADHINSKTGSEPGSYVDYHEMIEKENLDAVCIGTPDHWHHKQAVDSLKAGLNVCCGKPMTKRVEEAFNVETVWKESGKVMSRGEPKHIPGWKAGDFGSTLIEPTSLALGGPWVGGKRSCRCVVNNRA